MAKPESAPVAVVVVNYNRAELLRACLDSIFRQTAPPAEVIVVDNGSRDGSAEMVEQKFADRVKLLRLPRNLGFAGGNNAGIAAARSEWIALLNNDAVADPHWLREMLRVAEGEEIGLCACRILTAERRELLDNVGVGLWSDGMSRGRAHFQRDAEVVNPGVLLPSGCAMLVRRRAFAAAGGFDESFFCYSEDTDLGLKIRLAGWKSALADRAVVYHRVGGTLGVVSPEKLYLVERNRLAILLRYYPLPLLLLSPFFTAARYLGLLAAMLRLRRGPAPASPEQAPAIVAGGVGAGLLALCRAYRDALRRMPADLRRRRKLRKESRLPLAIMKTWLKKYGLDRRSLFGLEAP